MKPANILWQELNKNRYNCPVCCFNSFNRAHYLRHNDSSKHFLLTDFKSNCPRDIRILIASFLPLYKVIRLKHIGPYALRLAWRQPARYEHCPLVVPSLTFGDQPIVSPPFRTAGGEAWTIDTLQDPIFGLLL
jgi:hypothetical protein